MPNLIALLCCTLVVVPACIKLPQKSALPLNKLGNVQSNSSLININTASIDELERLPGLGTTLAERIVEHRNKHGRFRRVEHLITVRGISRRRFEELRPFVTLE